MWPRRRHRPLGSLSRGTDIPIPPCSSFRVSVNTGLSSMLEATAVGGATRTWLDLGEVRELAEVVLNGTSLGVVWKPPFRLEVTGKLRAGRNEIQIRVDQYVGEPAHR